MEDFEILNKGFTRRKQKKKKISEALFIKENNPSLNRQEKSFPFKAFKQCELYQK